MSDSRRKAAEYSQQVRKINAKSRKRQPDVFGKPKTGPPSYAFQDQQRGEIDNIADETRPLRDEEKRIEEDAEKDIVDKKSFNPGPESGKNPTPLKTTRQPAAQSELKSAFSKCWTIVDTINIPAVIHDEKSWYIPSGITIFETLFQMEDLLIGNEELRWISPHYFSLPVRVYYAVIYYVQCLRAKEQSGLITKPEGSWLRAFFRRYKDVACPIAGPLVPIFSNIVSNLPDDNQFDFVTPTIPENGTHRVEQTTDTPPIRTLGVRDVHHLVPSVPMIASILRAFCHLAAITNNEMQDGSFVPFLLSAGGNIAGVTIPAQAPGANDAQISKLLANPTIARPPPEGKERLKEIHPYWRRSRVRRIPEIPHNAAYDPRGPHDLTLLGEDFDWFQPCVDMANIQTKFFSDSTNLSSIPTVGGMSSTVICHLSFRNDDVPDDSTMWYPDQYDGSKATFTATSSSLELDSQYEAAYALTNVELQWQDNNHHPIGGNHAPYRNGPYWNNNKKTYELEHAVPVMTGIYTMIQTQFYDAHGHA